MLEFPCPRDSGNEPSTNKVIRLKPDEMFPQDLRENKKLMPTLSNPELNHSIIFRITVTRPEAQSIITLV